MTESLFPPSPNNRGERRPELVRWLHSTRDTSTFLGVSVGNIVLTLGCWEPEVM